MSFFQTNKDFKTVVGAAKALSAKMLSDACGWEAEAKKFRTKKPGLFPGLLPQIRVAIDGLGLDAAARVVCTDQLSHFRTGLLSECPAEHVGELRKLGMQTLVEAQELGGLKRTGSRAMALKLYSVTPHTDLAAVAVLDAWNYFIASRGHLDAITLNSKIIRGYSKLRQEGYAFA